ncbi:TorF family putative porin [Massilia pseudoviolaceinigra]|uniref:TorF family putative porin n=1 Tax=Massilia pseudoviolaceinigra TaxID=3057165 RepID=UPI002796A0B1|nr:TorF family putative porin [Massilia sp. CCM 9206]MDQ1922060.1 TorF family putative porin [Massilia sp. CCM 9206]
MPSIVKQRYALSFVSLLALASQASAQSTPADAKPAAAAPTTTMTANVTLASQYISRGFRQTWGKPALQGGFDIGHPSGLSAGIWMSTVSNRFVEDGTLEVDMYGGYTGTAGPIGYSALLYYYKYPGAKYNATGVSYDYGELSLGMTYKFFYAKYNSTYTKDFFGITNARGTGYLDVGANVDLGSGYTLNLHAGDGRVHGAGNDIWNWRDVKVGVSKAFDGGWTMSGAYTKARGATNAYDAYTLGIADSSGKVAVSNPAVGTFVVALTKTF